jgi:flagellar assembly protein FliH
MSHHPVLRDAVLGSDRLQLRRTSSANGGLKAVVDAHPQRHASEVGPALEEARVEGYAQGMQQGLQDAAAQVAAEVAACQRQLAAKFEQAEAHRASEHTRRAGLLESLAQSLDRAAEAQRRSIESQAIAVAFAALCKILGPSGGRLPQLTDLVEQGLRQLRGSTPLAVRLHPRDLAEMQAAVEGQSLIERCPNLRWMADANVERGGCMLQTDRGWLDASLHTQLSRLRELWGHSAGEAGA